MIKNLNLLKYFYFYFLFFTFGTIIFLCLVWLDFFHSAFQFFGFVYNLLLSIILMMILFLSFKKYFNFFNFINKANAILVILIFFFSHYYVYSFFPFNTSRSISVMIMGHFLKNNENSFSEEEINNYIYHTYFIKENAVKKRLQEQIDLGHLELKDNKYKITNKGKRNINLMGKISQFYKIDKNYALD